MERLKERIADARRALATFQKNVGLAAPTEDQRDSAIKRFEFSFEAVWKAVQHYLEIREKLTIGSPGSCIRASRDISLLSDVEARGALKMAAESNLSVHTYKEDLAKEIYGHLPRHFSLLTKWLDRMEERLNRIR